MKNLEKYSIEKFDRNTLVITEWLYGGALFLHLIWFFWVIYSLPVPVINDFSLWLIKSYNSIGFKWSLNNGTVLIAAGMLSTIFVNIFRRFVEGVILGWPRFTAHSPSTIKGFILRAIGYSLLCFIGLGAWGSNMTDKFVGLIDFVNDPESLDMINIVIIAVVTFMLGCFVNIIDDAISSIIIYFIKE